MNARFPVCSRTDAVLALHLDGDLEQASRPDGSPLGCPTGGPTGSSSSDVPAGGHECDLGYAFVCADSLHAHLRNCVVCQGSLRRARRLDALLAQTAGQQTAGQFFAGQRFAGQSERDHGNGAGSTGDLERRWFAAVASANDVTAASSIDGPPGPASRGACANPVASDPPPADTRVAAVRGEATPRSRRERRILLATAAGLSIFAVLIRFSPALPVVASPCSVGSEAALGHRLDPASGRAAVHERPHRPESGGPESGWPASHDATPQSTFTTAAIERLNRQQRVAAEERFAAGQAPTTTIAESGRRLADGVATPSTRLSAANLLLRTARHNPSEAPRAYRALIDGLAGCGDRTKADQLVHGDVLDLVRATPAVLAELRQRLWQLEAMAQQDAMTGEPAAGPSTTRGTPSIADLAVLVVAARVGTRELDDSIRRAVRRLPSLAAPLAGSLRSGQRHHGGGRLLLSTWEMLSAVGAEIEDAETAALWFHGQPACVLAEVAAELAQSRSGPHRRRCLLALGHAGDDSTVPVLLPHLQSAHRDEAHVAAFALTSLPHDVLSPLVDVVATSWGNDGWLLQAALTRAGLPATQPWLEALQLRPDERRRFRGATLAEFPAVAHWFRDRGPMLGD